MQARKLLVIADSEEKAFARAKILTSKIPANRVMFANTAIKSVLGKESIAVIYNCYQGFDPDMLGAIGGTIIAGGMLILITPLLEDWPGYTDPFNGRIANWPYQASDLTGYYIQRFVNQLKHTSFVDFLLPDSQLPISIQAPVVSNYPPDFKTEDQIMAINTILDTVYSEPPNTAAPIVLEADRGRGKSAVLGMVAKQFQTQNLQIVVTAPSRKTADVIFYHAGDQAPLSFIAPDLLCRELPKADLLFVDEAAAIPSPLLTQMLRHYPKIVFSTTVHGYEGTGRGFALRFKQQLDRLTPHWKLITLMQPIRYAEHDPLERFLFDSLLLDAKPVSSDLLPSFQLADCSYHQVSSAVLINDESLLREVFGLLVLAHYQTRPTDLRHLLDGKNITVTIIKWRGHVIATALQVEEGGFDADLAHEIHYGRRRPRGHLVPQSLAFHAGIADAPLYTTTRIMRIVVHPALHKQGIASLLLSKIQRDSSADYLSTSFGATQGLLEFWGKLDFQVVRMGFSRDASSGSHSVILLKPLSQQGIKLCQRSREQFQRYLPVLLTEPLLDLEEGLIEHLCANNGCHVDNGENKRKASKLMTKQDQQDIRSFTDGNRGYECCMLALHTLVTETLKDESKWLKLDDVQQHLLKDKVIHHHPWHQIIKRFSLSGKKQALREFRQIIANLQTL